ncbi:MAG: phage integrase family protein [Kiritimatiellaeota bacterium]|nr:phage integrase family protein [Kiritimatiellota bacterium]
MAGCMPLTAEQIQDVLRHFDGGSEYSIRARALFVVGINLGLRISELLSLNLGDAVSAEGEIEESVYIQRRHIKRKRTGRIIPVNFEARQALEDWIPVLNRWGGVLPSTPLFCSRSLRRLSRFEADKILRPAFAAAQVHGRRGTHVLRKTFARRVYYRGIQLLREGEYIEPMRLLKEALGHGRLETTERYTPEITRRVWSVIANLGEHGTK